MNVGDHVVWIHDRRERAVVTGVRGSLRSVSWDTDTPFDWTVLQRIDSDWRKVDLHLWHHTHFRVLSPLVELAEAMDE